MNCVRYMHASCALDDQIYIFSGMRDLSEEEQYLQKDVYFPPIERLNTTKVKPYWQEIKVKDGNDMFGFLMSPAVSVLNRNEVLILGGQAVLSKEE